MEPPCEHGGVQRYLAELNGIDQASMEPPCEHGGVLCEQQTPFFEVTLQWSRRVNTAE